jgi:hypothetical protein
MAPCWKLVWNVDPLALSVPLREELLDEDALVPDEELPPDGELLLDEEHAARDKTTATPAPPANVTCLLPRSRISEFSL